MLIAIICNSNSFSCIGYFVVFPEMKRSAPISWTLSTRMCVWWHL